LPKAHYTRLPIQTDLNVKIENSSRLFLRLLAIFITGSLTIFLTTYLSDPAKNRLERVTQAQSNILSSVQEINEASVSGGESLKKASLKALDIMRKSARDISSEYFLVVAQALQDAHLPKETVEMVDLSLMHPVSFREKLDLLNMKADALALLQRWENTRTTFESAVRLIQTNESFYTDPERLGAAYFSIYFSWIDLETQLKACINASQLFADMTTATWYRQLPARRLAEIQNFIDRIDYSISFACAKGDLSRS